MGSMDCSRLKRFYLANKSMLDTHLDLIVSFLTYITRLDKKDMAQPPEAAPAPIFRAALPVTYT